MPVVPVTQQQVQNAPLPNASLTDTAPSADALGGGVARGLGAVANAAQSIAVEEKKKADQVAFIDADRKLSEATNRMQYDPHTGIANTHGPDALALPEHVLQGFDQTAGDISQGLTNDDQRAAFQRSAAARRQDLDAFTQRHVSNEIQQYDDATTQSYIKNAQDSAALNYQDPQRINLELDRQHAALTDYAQRHGRMGDWLTQKIAEANDKTHIGVLDRMLVNNQDQQAKSYFDTYRGDISGANIAKVEKAVEAGTLRGDSQRKADDIIGTHSDRLSALDAVTSIQDPKLRDATNQRVEQYFSQKKQAESDRRNDLFLQASQALEQNKGNLDTVSPAALIMLEPAQRHALEQRSRQIREGVEPVQNDKVWVNFLDTSPTDLTKLTQADMLTKYRPYLDNSHWDRATTLWKSAQDGTGNSEHLTNALTFKDRVDNAFRATGIVNANKAKSKFSNDDAKAYGQFETEAATALQQYEQTQLGGKRKASGQEMQKVIDDLLTKKVFIDKTWARDPELPAVLVSEDKRARAYVPIDKIPQGDRNAIENIIRSRGKRISEDKVQRAYAQYIIGDRAAADQVMGE